MVNRFRLLMEDLDCRKALAELKTVTPRVKPQMMDAMFISSSLGASSLKFSGTRNPRPISTAVPRTRMSFFVWPCGSWESSREIEAE